MIFWFYILITSLKDRTCTFSLSALLSFSFVSLFGFHILNPDVLFVVFLLLSFLVHEKKDSKLSSFIQYISLGIFVLAFSYTSLSSLSIKSRTERFGWEQDYGLYREEIYEEGKFRWTKKGAGFETYFPSSFFSINFHASHPDMERKPVKVHVFISENPFSKKKKIDEFFFRERKWERRGYFIEEFSEKKAFLSFKISRTWNPMKELKVRDPRNIGIGIGEIKYELENEIGFYQWERAPEGIPFRWTSLRAWKYMVPEKENLIFPIKISHPDAERRPVEVIITVNGERMFTEILNDHNWYEVELDLKKFLGKKILMGFLVSRTWCPWDYGIHDKRELGLAVGKIN